MNCKNCNSSLHGNFCSECGQKASLGRINFRYLMNEIPNSLFQLNRGLFFTIKELFFRPGESLRGFLAGKRVFFYKPINFLLITSTIYILSTYLLGRDTFLYDLIAGVQAGVLDIEPNKEIPKTPFLVWFAKYQAYIPLFILLFYSLSTYIAFIRSGYNYFEHLVINIYIAGQQMLIYWCLSFVFFRENIFMVTPIVVGFIYNIWCFSQLFEEKKRATKLGLIALSYLLFFVQICLLAFIAFGLSMFGN